MSQAIKNVIVIGGSGNLGGPILQALLDSSAFTVSVLSRETSSATFPRDIQVHKTDFSDSDLISAFRYQDAVVSAVGMGGFEGQKRLIDAVVKAGVKRFIPSEFSVNTRSAAVQELVPAFKAKAEVLDYLKTKEERGLSWTGIATGLLFDWGLKSGFLGYDLGSNSVTIWDSGDQVFSTTNLGAVAQAVVSTLQRPEKTVNKYVYVASCTTSQNELLAALEKETQKTWEVKHTATEAQVKTSEEMISNGDLTGNFGLVLASMYGKIEGLRANYAKEESLANELLGLPIESLGMTVSAVIKEI